jgi:hypothetical protein
MNLNPHQLGVLLLELELGHWMVLVVHLAVLGEYL